AFLATLGAAVAGVRPSLAADAQRPAGRLPTVAILSPAVESAQNIARGELEAGLRKLGWRPGENIVIARRMSPVDRLPELAAELVRLKVDIIPASSEALPAARDASRTVPILMAFGVDDPVEAGYVTSLGRPGTNITGIFLQAPEAGGKRLELLRAAIPALQRVSVISWPGRNSAEQIAAVERAGGTLGIRIDLVEMRDRAGYDSAFVAMARQGTNASLVLAS